MGRGVNPWTTYFFVSQETFPSKIPEVCNNAFFGRKGPLFGFYKTLTYSMYPLLFLNKNRQWQLPWWSSG